MKYEKWIIALFFGVLLFTVVNVIFSPTGTRAMESLISYRAELMANLEDLQKLNEKLSDNIEAFQSDRDLITRQARALGLYKDEEVVIRVQGYQNNAGSASAGRILRYGGYTQTPKEEMVRLFGLAGGLVTLLLLWLVDQGKREK